MTTVNILIATLNGVKKDKFQDFIDHLDGVAEKMGVDVWGVGIHDGPGCCNIALSTTGERWKELADHVTWALQPARWTVTKDEVRHGHFSTMGN
jgi:hypothetical protein